MPIATPTETDENALPSAGQAALPLTESYLSRFNPLKFHKRGSHTKALIALALVCFFWGTTWIATKEGVRYLPALQMAGIRQAIGGILYVAFYLLRGAPLPRGREWWPVVVMSFLNFMLSNALSAWGVKFISAGLGSIISAIFPLWIVLIGLFISKKSPQPKTLIGLGLGLVGICVVFYEHLHDFLNPEFRWGIFLSLASTWTWAIGTLYTKKQASRFNPYFSLGLQMIISGAVLTGVTYTSGIAIPLANIPWQSWSAIAYLVLFGSVIAFAAYLYALQHLPTVQASIYAYINPLVAILLGWAFFSEKLTSFIITGTIITLYGVYLVNRGASKANPNK